MKPRTFTKINKTERATLLLSIMLIGVFAISGAYYALNVAPYAPQPANNGCPATYILTNGVCKADPFTLEWNGSITGISPVAIQNVTLVGTSGTGTGSNQFISTISVHSGDLIVVDTAIRSANCGDATEGFSDSQGNDYTTTAICNALVTSSWGNAGIYTRLANATSTGLDSLYHVSHNGIPWVVIVSTYRNVAHVDDLETLRMGCSPGVCGATFSGASPHSSTLSFALHSSGSWIKEDEFFFTTNNPGGSFVSTDSGQDMSLGSCVAAGCPVATAFNDDFKKVIGASSPQSVTISAHYPSDCSGGDLTCSIGGGGFEMVAFPAAPATDCPEGYKCLNSIGTSDGHIRLSPNSTYAGEMLTNSPVDLSTVASKELLFFETFINRTNLHVGDSWAWYLTENQTLPMTQSYSPLNDRAVRAVMICYDSSNNKIDCYIYLSKRAASNGLLPDSGFASDPLQGSSSMPNCNQASTLYICMNDGNQELGFSTFTSISAALNFTGTSSGSGTNQNWSLGCAGDNSVLALSFCSTAPGGQDTNTCLGFTICATQTLPYLRLSSPFYVGFWASTGSGVIDFGARMSGGAFAERANTFWLWVPNSVTVNPQTDTGSFFGWLGNTIAGVWTATTNTLTTGLAPILNVGGSLIAAIISGFVQVFSILLIAFRLSLNIIGNFFGWGNIGDTFVTLLTSIGALIVNGFSAIVGFFVGIGSIITSGYFAFLAGAAVLIGALLPLAIILWNIIFNGAFTVTDILFFDYVLGMFLVSKAIKERKSALKAFLGWVSLNVFIFTFVFEAAWAIFDIVTRPIHRTKETVDPL